LGLIESLGTGANLTTDVQLAAHAIETGAEMHSHDMDFGRFADLRWIDPLRDQRPRRRVHDG
jgi:predicted nucleic acid-binding protein